MLISYGLRVWFVQFHVLSLQDPDFQAPRSQIILTYVCNVLQNAALDLISVHSAASDSVQVHWLKLLSS